MARERTNQFFYFKITLAIWLIEIAVIYALYQHVNDHVTLSPKWSENVFKLYPNARINSMF